VGNSYLNLSPAQCGRGVKIKNKAPEFSGALFFVPENEPGYAQIVKIFLISNL